MVNKLRNQMKEYFVGNEGIVDNLLVCLFASGHVLLEGVPGVGKTTLARILSKSVNCDFGRIQFTPDTLPTDVIGTEIYNMKTSQFEYREGAIMHQIVLADEINRTSPKTQSALLEAMGEGQTTVGGVKYKLPAPFMVIATQNPSQFMGTYPLPEAQIDRFMMKLTVGYPSAEEELRMAQNMISGKMDEDIKDVIKSEEVVNIQKQVAKITIKEEVLAYIREIVNKTRSEKNVVLGASPRAVLALVKASQAKAYVEGRDYVKPDDVKAVAYPVLGHRLVLSAEAKLAGTSEEDIIKDILLGVKVPY